MNDKIEEDKKNLKTELYKDDFRIEHDLLGNERIPKNSYWGIHTYRALNNFNLAERKVNFQLIKAIAVVKKACALTNYELNYISKAVCGAIVSACDEIYNDKIEKENFPTDALQGGAGTSTNMNVNEVIANRGIEILGEEKGNYSIIHPIEHVNLHQSTNDVYPTALKIAAIEECRKLNTEIAKLQGICQEREKAFQGIIKMGRTQMQEAVPILLGQEFGAFAEAFSRDRWRTFKCEERLKIVNIGGTAVGTGIGANKKYIFRVIEILRSLTGMNLSRGENLLDATSNVDCFVEVSGMLKAFASNLSKVSQDLRLMAVLGEITLPPKQAGSSIMPGKVNPVIIETVLQGCMKVIANDIAISCATSNGTLQINEFMPLIADSLLDSFAILRKSAIALGDYIRLIAANPLRCEYYVNRSTSIITAFLPAIGYEKCTALVKEFQRLHPDSEASFRGFLEENLGKEIVDKYLDPKNLIQAS